MFELPFLRLARGRASLHRPARESLRSFARLLELYPDFSFAADEIHGLIETPEKTFAEYVAHAHAAGDWAKGPSSVHPGNLVAEAR
jgi:hypothetical protein